MGKEVKKSAGGREMFEISGLRKLTKEIWKSALPVQILNTDFYEHTKKIKIRFISDIYSAL